MRTGLRVLGLAILGGALVLASCGGGGGGPTDPPDPNTIGPAGGTVSLGSSALVEIPAGALTQSVRINVEPVATPADLLSEGAVGQAYRFSPIDLVFSKPVRISIHVPESALGGRSFSATSIRRSDAVSAELFPAGEALGGVQHSQTMDVSGTTTRLGVFSATLPNQTPTADAGTDLAGTVGESVSLAGTGADPDGDPLTFQWSFDARPTGSAATIQAAGSANAAFVPDAAGTYVIRLTVDDGRGGTASDTVTVVVVEANGNQAPVADAGVDQSVDAGTQVTLDGSGSSDPDGDPLVYSWRWISGPSSVTVRSSTSSQAHVTLSTPGEYVFELTVSDGMAIARDSVRVTAIRPNRAPTVSASAPEAVYAGGGAEVQATVNDPDGDPVSVQFVLSARPPGSSATLQVAGDRAILSTDLVGLYLVQVTADDGRGGTAEETVGVYGNPHVDGDYAAAIDVTISGGSCPASGGGSENGTLSVMQPDPATVVLDLPSATSGALKFTTAPQGTQQGNSFHFSGTVSGSFTTDPNDPSSTTNFSANGTISGTLSEAGVMDLNLSFSVFGICGVDGTIQGTKN